MKKYLAKKIFGIKIQNRDDRQELLYLLAINGKKVWIEEEEAQLNTTSTFIKFYICFDCSDED